MFELEVDMLVLLEENLNVKVGGERLIKVKTMQDVHELVSEAQTQSISV